jgi:HD-like signal output (HDOD) protein
MPERNGHALAVDALAAGPDRPVVVVLTGLLEPRLAADLVARGVDDITFKPVDFRVLAAKTRALCKRRTRPRDDAQASATATATTPQVAIDQVEQRLDAMAGKLPVSPAALEIVNLIESCVSSVDAVARALAHDAALTVEILRLANSAAYNTSGKRIEDIRDAVARVGDRQICQLAIAMAAMRGLGSDAPAFFDIATIWRRSIASSLVLKELIPAADIGGDDEGLFVSSLLLPMSRLVMALALPELYERLWAEHKRTGESLNALERRTLPMPPARAMAGMLARWKLPPRLFKPLQRAELTYQDVSLLTDPLRSKVERLRFAEFAAQLVVGTFESWEEIDLPTSQTLSRLRVGDLFVLLEDTRSKLTELPVPQATSSSKVRRSAPRTAVAPLRYCKLGSESCDLIALILHALDVRFDRIPREEAVSPVAALVNCLNADQEREQWFYDNAIPDSRRAIVVNAPLPATFDSWGPVIQLPCSFQAWSEAVSKISRDR